MQEIVAVLVNIRSLHNVGSIFRTSDSAGIKKLYLCGITPSPKDRFDDYIPQFTKVSLGAEKTVEWTKEHSALRTIKKLKKEGYAIYLVEQSKKSIPYHKAPKNKKIALVVGNEVKGLPPAILKAADKVLEIPMRGSKESLNVSVAFGIVAYRLIF
jgi:tRNA G18 (ribose-2'-O)-methylase SpoU